MSAEQPMHQMFDELSEQDARCALSLIEQELIDPMIADLGYELEGTQAKDAAAQRAPAQDTHKHSS